MTFSILLTIILAVLKLCGIATIPWLWVFCPIWIPLVFAAIMGLISLLLGGIGLMIAAICSRK